MWIKFLSAADPSRNFFARHSPIVQLPAVSSLIRSIPFAEIPFAGIPFAGIPFAPIDVNVFDAK